MITVYTCIAGKFDRLKRQPDFADVRYVCFSDDQELLRANNLDGWEILPVENPEKFASPHLINRYYKIMGYNGFQGSAVSIYIDGNVVLKRDPKPLVGPFMKSGASLGAFRHPDRKSVLAEFDACLELGNLPTEKVASVNSYRSKLQADGFDCQLGLSTNYLLLRQNQHPALAKVMQSWWNDVSLQCHRDQLALQYVLWKAGQTWFPLDNVISRQQLLYHTRHGYPSMARNAWDSVRRLFGRRIAG